MPKRNKHRKRPKDVNELAHYLVGLSTQNGPSEDPLRTVSRPAGLSEYMAAIGQKGGQIGGKRRLRTMTAEERTAVARKAAQARWERKEQ